MTTRKTLRGAMTALVRISASKQRRFELTEARVDHCTSPSSVNDPLYDQRMHLRRSLWK